MVTHHAAVWIDHNEARIFHVTGDDFDAAVVHAVIQSPSAHTQLHRKSESTDGHRAKENQPYYHAVAQALADADEVLVLGPSTAKLELIKHAHKRDPKLEARIVGVETVDHPSDRQLAAHVLSYFKDADGKRSPLLLSIALARCRRSGAPRRHAPAGDELPPERRAGAHCLITGRVHCGLTACTFVLCPGIQNGGELGSIAPPGAASFSRSTAMIQSCLHCCCP